MARTKLLLFGAAVVAAGVLLKRDKVAGLLPGRGQTYEPPAPPPPPAPSNYDVSGPVANTATPVPAPDPQEPEAIDEAAEEAAAAAEAANIGGVVSDYAGISHDRATEAERPLVEAGEGESEGLEQAEHDLVEAAEPTAPGISDAERAIDDAIDEAANPLAGEQIEPLASSDAEIERDAEPLPDTDAAPVDQPTDTSSGWSPPVPERTDEPAPFEEQPTEVQGEQTQFEPPTSSDDDEKKTTTTRRTTRAGRTGARGPGGASTRSGSNVNCGWVGKLEDRPLWPLRKVAC